MEGEVKVDWDAYFESIKHVCPWSYGSWCAGMIDIVYTSTPLTLYPYHARIYIVDIHNYDLKAYSEYLNDTSDDEWFYSDPKFKGNSAPVSILIQQDHKYLHKIRKKLLLM